MGTAIVLHGGEDSFAGRKKIINALLSIGVPEGKIELIYNGVDLQEFQPGKVPRGSLGLPDGVPMALFCGDIRQRRERISTPFLKP